MLRLSFALLSLLAAALPAQIPEPAAKASKLRVHVIGASVSGGFRDGPMFGATEQGDSVTMQQLLRKWAGDNARVTTHNTIDMMAMFTDPSRLGAEQIAGVKKAKPDLVVAIDFPFWFAYGYVRGEQPEAEARKERLQEGLDLLGSLDMPVLLGDLPDMTGAAERMLSRRQIPSPEVLTQLNAQLTAFVAKHGNLHLMSLSKAVQAMRTEGVTLPLADGPLPTAPGALQQGDKLHANRLGMAYLGSLLQAPLRDLFPEGHALRAQQWTIEQFVEATGAEGDLELQREAAAAEAK
jgi:hypothetical protein